VADREDYLAYTLDRLGDSWWREVVLLEAGYLSTQGKRRATELVEAVMDCKQEPEPYHNLVLAAEAVRDVGRARLAGDLAGEIQTRLRQAFQTPLKKGVDDLPVLVRRRAAAAEALARIESGVFGAQPAFWRLPHGEPVWVEIPAGEFWMGGERYDEEKPVHRVHLELFWISRVPVTNAQYQFFVEASGHGPPRHWEDGRPPRGQESHPVVHVSWHEALAYCRWLSEVTGKPITLPSEAEWEKAARGAADKREYPWGDWQEGRANTEELGLNDTTPVGIVPEGASPHGVLDMAGNVWEWTRSVWGPFDERRSKLELQFPYPYDPEDAREDLELDDNFVRVLRGGSFYLYQDLARCAFRYWVYPGDRDWYGGFRVVVSHLRSAL
jgi:formylglycine-generating enzyme required for sulfatase activity